MNASRSAASCLEVKLCSAPTTSRLLAAPAPVHAAMAYDARHLTLTTVAVPEDLDEVRTELRILDLDTGAAEVVPDAHSATWSPWGRRLAWIGADGLVVRDHTGRVRALPGTGGVSGPPAWSPEGARIAFTAPTREPADTSLPFRWSRPYLAHDGLGPLDAPPQVHVCAPDGSDPIRLTDDEWRWGTLRWSPDGDRLAACATTDPSGLTGGQRLHLLGLDGSRTTPELPHGRAVVPAWLTPTSLVALVFEPSDRPAGALPALYLVEDDVVRRVELRDSARTLGGDVYGDQPGELVDSTDVVLEWDERTVVVRTAQDGAMGIAFLHLDPDGETAVATLEPIVEGPRIHTPVGAGNGRLVMATMAPDAPAGMSWVDLETGAEHAILAGPSTGVVVERLEVRTDAPGPVRAWFLRHQDAPAGPLPTVLLIHGGPHYSYGEAFSLDAHALLAAGFAVVYANPRGSTGVSEEFAAAVHGDWADGPSRDLLAVLDELAVRGWSDPDRLGVTGNSYGGYLAAWLATTTHRFRAAVAENPVTDPMSMYFTSDIGPWFFAAQFGGTPYDVPERYLAQSPLMRARECATPLLFVTGRDDRRCPPSQTWAMHCAVHATGAPSEVLVLPDSSHEGSTYGPPAGRRAHDAALVEWFGRWLAGPPASRPGA